MSDTKQPACSQPAKPRVTKEYDEDPLGYWVADNGVEAASFFSWQEAMDFVARQWTATSRPGKARA